MTTVDAAPVTLDIDSGGIARLRLNRPDASNGLNVELLKALHEAILRCHAETSVRVVLLSGAGRNFCAGGDIHTFESKGAELPQYLREATAWLQLVTSALIQLRVPVVTAPAAVRNHPTLLSTQLVNVLKKPPTTVFVTVCVTQLSG